MADPTDDLAQGQQKRPEQSPVRALLLDWPRVAVVVALFGVLTYLVSSLQPEHYRATADVFLLTPQEAAIPSQGPTPDAERRVRNEAEVMVSRDVADLVSKQFRSTTAAEVQKSVKASPSAETDVVTLSAEASTGAGALRLLNAVESSYEKFNVTRTQKVYADALARLERNRRDLETDLRSYQTAVAANPDDVASAQQRDSVSQQIANVRSQESQLALNQVNAGSGVRAYEPPDTPTEPVSPKPLRNALLGALLGLFVAMPLTWWRVVRSRSADDPERAAARLGVPLLGEVGAKPSRRAGRGAVARRPRDVYHWIFAMVDRGVRASPSNLVVVTSADDAAASASVSVNLAASAAEDGRSVLLIDGDMRTGLLTSMLHAENRPGFSQVVSYIRRAREAELMVQVYGIAIRFVPVGATWSDAGSIYPSQAALDTLGAFDEAADLVLLHLPPLGSCAETSMLSQRAAGVVVVVSPQTRLSMLDKVRSVTESFDLKLFGYVFDRSAPRSRRVLPRDAAEKEAVSRPGTTSRGNAVMPGSRS